MEHFLQIIHISGKFSKYAITNWFFPFSSFFLLCNNSAVFKLLRQYVIALWLLMTSLRVKIYDVLTFGVEGQNEY